MARLYYHRHGKRYSARQLAEGRIMSVGATNLETLEPACRITISHEEADGTPVLHIITLTKKEAEDLVHRLSKYVLCGMEVA